MSVESFAQPPFIRPSQANSASASASASSIRIFGIDINSTLKTSDSISGIVVDPIRRFECQYCSHNIPGPRRPPERAQVGAPECEAGTHAVHPRSSTAPLPVLNHCLAPPSQPITGSPLPQPLLWRVGPTSSDVNRKYQQFHHLSFSFHLLAVCFVHCHGYEYVVAGLCATRLGAPRPQENVSLDLHL